jgi:two-component system, NarL family, nitrate/nitrite response regulator NarL
VRQISAQERPIRVAIHVADRPLRERLIRALAEAGDFASAGLGDADVTIADRPPDVAGPVIALAPTALLTIAQAIAWRCDVRAVLPADLDPMTLGAVITVIAAGLSVAPPDPARGAGNLVGNRAGSWAETLDHSGVEDEEPAAILTRREREVLTLLAAGASNKAIARTLGLSVHTVKFHVASLIDKLGARGRVEAVAIALRTGLIMV